MPRGRARAPAGQYRSLAGKRSSRCGRGGGGWCRAGCADLGPTFTFTLAATVERRSPGAHGLTLGSVVAGRHADQAFEHRGEGGGAFIAQIESDGRHGISSSQAG